jgi:arylformamidase
MVLADQVRCAIAWLYNNAALLSIEPNQLYVGGQSSGGHLAAAALTTDWPSDFGLPADIIKGGIAGGERKPGARTGRLAYEAHPESEPMKD